LKPCKIIEDKREGRYVFDEDEKVEDFDNGDDYYSSDDDVNDDNDDDEMHDDGNMCNNSDKTASDYATQDINVSDKTFPFFYKLYQSSRKTR
jgi:hypothetical protein